MYDVFYLQVPGFRMFAFFYIQNKFLLRLKPLDVEFMKALHNKVNIVPVISKADTLTLSEVRNLKKRILSEIAEHGIKIYHLPDADDDEDEEFKEQTRNLKVRSLRIKLCVPGCRFSFRIFGQLPKLENTLFRSCRTFETAGIIFG